MTRDRNVFIILWAISGLVTLGILAMPSIVVLGFILFIIPGLVLSIIPVYFCYTTVYFVINQMTIIIATKLDLRLTKIHINCSAIMIVGIMAIIIPAFVSINAKSRMEFSTLPDIIQNNAVDLYGDVRIEGSNLDEVNARARKILQLSEVTSVTISISPNEGYEDLKALKSGATNSKPGRLISLRELPQLGRTYRLNQLANCRRFVNDMPDADAKICMVESSQIAHYDFLLRDGHWKEHTKYYDNWSINRPVTVDYAEVRSRDKVLARKWMAETSTLTIPILAFPECGGVYETNLCWSMKRLGNSQNGDTPRVDKFVRVLQ